MADTSLVVISGTDRTSLAFPGSITVQQRTNQRWTAAFRLGDVTGAYRPNVGENVVIWGASLRLFSGTIDQVAEIRMARGPGRVEIWLDILCTDLSARLDQRVCDVPKTYKAVTAGSVILDVMANFATGEGIAFAAAGTGGYVADGATVTKYVVDHQTVGQVVADMTALSGFVSFVSADGDLHHQVRNAEAAPFAISDISHNWTGMTVTKTREDYYNESWTQLSWAAFTPTTETLHGNSSTRVFTLAHPAAQVDSIQLNGADVAFGSNTENYVWQPGESTITQDVSQTILTSGDNLVVVYRELGADWIFADISAEISARAAIEGNSGHYSRTFQQQDQTNATSANADANAAVALAAHIPVVGSVISLGFGPHPIHPRPGMVVTVGVTTPQIAGSFLIQDVTAQHIAGLGFQYTFTMLDGTRIGNWVDYFKALAGQGASSPTTASGVLGGGGGGTAPAAPNVTATAAVFFQPFGNGQQFGFSGVITLPTTDPNYTHLARIDVFGRDPSGAVFQVASFTTWAGSTIAYSGVVGSQPTSAQIWDVLFIVYNEDGVPSVSPFTVPTLTVHAAAVTSISSAAEIGTRFVDDLSPWPHLTVGFVPVFTGGQVPQNVTYLISADNGVTYTWIGWTLVTAVGQQVKIDRFAPATAQTWKVAAVAGAVGGLGGVLIPAASLPSGAVVSTGFSVGGIPVPSATAVPATATAGATVTPMSDQNGAQWVVISGVTYTDPTDPQISFIRITVQDYDINGTTPLSLEKLYAGTWVTGGSHTTDPLTASYLKSADGTYRCIERYRAYASNPISGADDAYKDITVSKLQNCWAGAANHFDVVVGPPPVGGIPATRIDPSTWGPGIIIDLTTGKPKVGTVSNAGNILVNPGFEDILAGWNQFGVAGWTAYSGAFTGTLGILAPAPGGTGTWLNQTFSCRQGDAFYSEVYYSSAPGATGNFSIIYWYLDGSGTIITTAQQLGGPTSGVYTKLSFVIPAAPTGTSSIRIFFGAMPSSTGTWVMDNAWFQRQSPTGAGLGPDGAGGVKIIPGGVSPTELAAAAVTAAKMAASSITVANAALAAASVVDSNVVTVGINKVTYGTTVFAGDVVLSRGIGQPIIVLANSGPLGSGIYLYGQADPLTGVLGVASKPFVVVQSTGIGLFSGGNSSVTMSASLMTFWSVNGNTAAPYVSIQSTGVSIVSGTASVVIGSSAVTITNGTLFLNLNGSTTKIDNAAVGGGVSGSGITITDNSNSQKVVITPVAIYFLDGSGNITAIFGTDGSGRGVSKIFNPAGGTNILCTSAPALITVNGVTVTVP